MHPFESGTVVWGLVPGWPWWPAVVVERATAEKYMSEKLKSELPKPSSQNLALKFFNYEDCYDVVATRNVRDFIKKFNQATFRKIHNFKDTFEIEIVDKAAEIALHWIVQNGNEAQRNAVTGNQLSEVQRICRERRILFPDIDQGFQRPQYPQILETAPISVARSFISPPRTSIRNFVGHSSTRPVSKTGLRTSDDVNNHDLLDNGLVSTNQVLVSSHAKTPSSPEKPMTIAEKSPIPQMQKEQVPSPAQVLARIPTVTSLGFVHTTPKLRCDFEEDIIVDGGDGNEILAPNLNNSKLNKRTRSGAGSSTNAIAKDSSTANLSINSNPTELQFIKQDVERSMKLLRSVIRRIEKFEQK